jgi:hypothetical protein
LVLVFGNRLLHASRFFEGVTIRLYLEQLRRALLALPVFLLWLGISRHPAVRRRLVKLGVWWQRSPIPPYLGPVFFFGLALLVANVAYHRMPKADAIWCLFQTKVFALGRLCVPVPEYPEFFWTRIVALNGKWFAYTSPGQSLVFLPGQLLGVAWLTGPLLGTLTLVLLYSLGVSTFGHRTSRIALLLAATSPLLLFMFGSHELNIASIFFLVLALFLLHRSRVNAGLGLLAGLCIGMVFLCRPLTAVGVGLPVLVFVAVRRRPALLTFVLGGSAMVTLHLLYNRALTGGYLNFPYAQLGTVSGIGFSTAMGESGFGMTGHSFLRSLANAGYGLFALSLQLQGWLFLSLVFVLPGLCTLQSRRNWGIWLTGLGLVITYAFFWFHGVTPAGPKYWSEAMPALFLLGAAGIRASVSSGLRWFGLGRDFACRAVPFLVLYSLAVYLPTSADYLARCRWGETPRVANAARAAGLHNALVFVYTDERSGGFDYTSAFVFNDPLLKGDVVYARDLGPENGRLMALYPERSYYRYDFNQETLEEIGDSR